MSQAQPKFTYLDKLRMVFFSHYINGDEEMFQRFLTKERVADAVKREVNVWDIVLSN